MTAVPKPDELRQILRDLKAYNGLRLLGGVVGVAERTLYRQAKPAPKHGINPKTSAELVRIFEELGLLGGYDLRQLLAAIEELKRRAEAAAADRDVGAIPPDGE